MTLKQDEIEIEIMPDGAIRILTPGISMPNHTNADKFLADIARLAGGDVTRERRTDVRRVMTHGHEEQIKNQG